MIYKLRARFAEYFIKRILSKSERKVHKADLQKAKSVGILFKDTNEKMLKDIEQFANELKTKFNVVDVDVLCYTTRRSKDFPAYIGAAKYTRFFSPRETNFFLKPTAVNVKQFLAKEFDVLIDFSKNKFEPLRYLTAMCDAPFKVGRYAKEDEEFYDLMIALEDHKTEREFFNQLMHYMGMINQTNDKK